MSKDDESTCDGSDEKHLANLKRQEAHRPGYQKIDPGYQKIDPATGKVTGYIPSKPPAENPK